MTAPLLSLELRLEHDVVLARQRARHVATLLGFDEQDCTRIATAVSEMARNAFKYAGGGKVEFSVTQQAPWSFLMKISDSGPGIHDLQTILDGAYRSSTGMGLGIIGARRLMDQFEIDSVPGRGTTITLGKQLPRRAKAPVPDVLAAVAEELAKQRPSDPIEELQLQNQELLRVLEEVRRQREQLAHLNQELEETNRGVVALYAELDERADYLQRANEIKTRFLSNMTHEFRTPLNSITSLARLLLQRLDGDLTSEQEKQIGFILKSAESLGELVSDLLDIAKVEAGKILVRPSEFDVAELFGALRGMLRPLLAQSSAINLIFEEPEDLPPICSDESKISQILRNFISNAIKYTERGEVRVSARRGSGDTVVFEVEDTGIGIAPDDQPRIFEEFTQVEHALQRRARGTGLGLPLSRKLAGLLGGSVGVKSELGKGSLFYAVIPATFKGPTEVAFVPEVSRALDPTRAPVLIVEDNRESLFIYEKYLKNTGFQVLPARTLKEAREWLRTVRPVAIILDILLETENTWDFLSELRRTPTLAGLPILVVTMVENEKRALALGADAFHSKPIDRAWLVDKLGELVGNRPAEQLLIIDDDEVSRYLLRSLLADTRFTVMEASSGREGLLLARDHRPRAIFLDLEMKGMNGYAVLDALKERPETRSIPVFIHTAQELSALERGRLEAAAAIIPKDSPTREAAKAAIQAAILQAGLGSVPAREEAPNA